VQTALHGGAHYIKRIFGIVYQLYNGLYIVAAQYFVAIEGEMMCGYFARFVAVFYANFLYAGLKAVALPKGIIEALPHASESEKCYIHWVNLKI
jgi:hypothetical protein